MEIRLLRGQQRFQLYKEINVLAERERDCLGTGNTENQILVFERVICISLGIKSGVRLGKA